MAMTVFIIDHRFHYETENLCRVFYPNTELKLEYSYRETDGDKIITSASRHGETTEWRVFANIGGSTAERAVELPADDPDSELELARCLFRCLQQLTGYTPVWGLLTGVRPVKLMNTLIAEMGGEKAAEYFVDKLEVTPLKTALAQRTAAAQKPMIAISRPRSFSLYVSIPFCPSRCSYCSFVSHSIANPNAAKLVAPYLENLRRELSITGDIASKNGLILESVYFGGGTPGILSPEQSHALISEIRDSFDMSTCREFTFEAGRADVITAEKLESLKADGVGRISVNPQTFDDKVLEAIGRRHTAEQAVQAFALARETGFDSVNIDLIAGLPGEGYEGFCASLDRAIELGGENITVHTLALKRASDLVSGQNSRLEQSDTAAKMLEYADKRLTLGGYLPYYLYRQSRCVGNLENVGWCLPGKECLYNIYMMEETHTVLAAGAGAVTRLKAPGSNHIERIFNFKYPYEYNSRFPELMERKARITSFCREYIS